MQGTIYGYLQQKFSSTKIIMLSIPVYLQRHDFVFGLTNEVEDNMWTVRASICHEKTVGGLDLSWFKGTHNRTWWWVPYREAPCPCIKILNDDIGQYGYARLGRRTRP